VSEASVQAASAAPARPSRHDLGEILLQTTALTEDQLEEARRKQAETGRRLTDVLVAANWVRVSSTCRCYRTFAWTSSTRR
jgi:hypothetical protein